MKIHYLKNNEINYEAYDFCIENSSQGTMYAMSWYLDITSPDWELLMADDYNYVMPIPVKKKLCYKYAIQPPVCQQLGIFSLKELTSEIFGCFIHAIPYRYCHFYLNAGNVFNEFANFKLNSNYELDLGQPYEKIKAGFSTNCIKNIKKAEKENLNCNRQTDIDIYVSLLKRNSINISLVKRLNILVPILKKTYGAKVEIWNISEENGEILAASPLVTWQNRVYNLAPVSTEPGKQKYAMFFLLDQFIRENSGNELILDFEGSMIFGVAQFYKGFGADDKPYSVFLKTNAIHSLLRNINTQLTKINCMLR